MKNGPSTWLMFTCNYESRHWGDQLSLGDVLAAVDEEVKKRFNAIHVQDTSLGNAADLFFMDDSAVVLFHEKLSGKQWSSENAEQIEAEESVRLSPDDTEDFSFQRGSVIVKHRALELFRQVLVQKDTSGLARFDEFA